MNFRDATEDDLFFIVDVYNSTVPGRMVTADTVPVQAKDKLNWFHQHNPQTRPLWIVTEEGKDMGWVSFNNFYGRPAYNGTAELSIYLHESARGKGLGKKILEACCAQAASLKINTLLGVIFAHNEPSLTLFKNAGFEEWAHLPNIALMDGKEYSVKILGKRISNL